MWLAGVGVPVDAGTAELVGVVVVVVSLMISVFGDRWDTVEAAIDVCDVSASP